MDYKKLGVALKNARIKSKLSQAQVSEYINKTAQNISSWELGKSKIDIDSFERLCKLYNISFTDTLTNLSGIETEEYMMLQDDDVIRIYRELDSHAKAFVKHAIYTVRKNKY